METQGVERRLSAVLAADVAGYGRLVGVDEEGPLAQLHALRAELIDPAIATHRGRIIKTTGVGILVESASVVEAGRCALDVQRGMAQRNAEIAADRRIVFRIGIHLGDVVVDGSDLLGDAVNVAARLEGIAEPGGICLSEDAWRQVRDKLPETFVDLGDQALKNIARPVEVLRGGEGNDGSERRIGLVSNLSGIFGKQACALFSNLPNADGYRFDGDYVGPAAIVGAIAICDTPQGRRTVVRSEDQALLESMTREEFCGRVVHVAGAAFRP